MNDCRMKASRSSLFRILRSAFCIFFIGCRAPNPPAVATQPTTAAVFYTPRIISISGHREQPADPRDPQPAVNAMVHLDVYTLELPVGTVSDSKAFWESVDEQAVGVDLEDRLSRSGIRTGLAPKSQGMFFSQFFDKQVIHRRCTTVNGLRAETVPLELGGQIDREDLFYFDPRGQNPGRTFDRCTNSMTIGFGPAPRDPGGVRLTVCPVVKCEREHLQYTSLNREFEVPATDDMVRLYDIGFSVDCPQDSFFIIAPSPDAWRPSSIGGRFLIHEDKSERLERVIVIVPTFMSFDGKPVTLQNVVR
jgi:hypothetical protein